MKSTNMRMVNRLRKLEVLVKLQITIIVVMMIMLGAFATHIYNATKLGEQIQSVEATYNI